MSEILLEVSEETDGEKKLKVLLMGKKGGGEAMRLD